LGRKKPTGGSGDKFKGMWAKPEFILIPGNYPDTGNQEEEEKKIWGIKSA